MGAWDWPMAEAPEPMRRVGMRRIGTRILYRDLARRVFGTRSSRAIRTSLRGRRRRAAKRTCPSTASTGTKSMRSASGTGDSCRARRNGNMPRPAGTCSARIHGVRRIIGRNEDERVSWRPTRAHSSTARADRPTPSPRRRGCTRANPADTSRVSSLRTLRRSRAATLGRTPL